MTDGGSATPDRSTEHLRPVSGNWHRTLVATFSTYAAAKATRDYVGRMLPAYQRIGIVSRKGRHHLYVYTHVSTVETGRIGNDPECLRLSTVQRGDGNAADDARHDTDVDPVSEMFGSGTIPDVPGGGGLRRSDARVVPPGPGDAGHARHGGTASRRPRRADAAKNRGE